MGFKRKIGRPKGTVTTGYINMDVDKKTEYHSDSVKKYCQSKQEKGTSKITETETPIQSTASSSRGRKESKEGPQTPNTRKRRKVETQTLRRSKEKISKMRSRLQYENWDKRNDRDDGNSSTEGETDVDTTDTSDDEVDVDVDEVDENNAAEAVLMILLVYKYNGGSGTSASS